MPCRRCAVRWWWGQSLGSGLVLHYGQAHPDRVQAQVVTNSLSAFPNLEVVELDAGHPVNAYDPTGWNAAVIRFLTTHRLRDCQLSPGSSIQPLRVRVISTTARQGLLWGHRSAPADLQPVEKPTCRPSPGCHDDGMIEVRRGEDGELCGYVAAEGDVWLALTVFGGELARCATHDDAVRTVLDDGLPSLAEHWILTGPGIDGDQIVCIQNVSPGTVSMALDYYSVPGTASMTLSAADLRSGIWSLRRAR